MRVALCLLSAACLCASSARAGNKAQMLKLVSERIRSQPKHGNPCIVLAKPVENSLAMGRGPMEFSAAVGVIDHVLGKFGSLAQGSPIQTSTHPHCKPQQLTLDTHLPRGKKEPGTSPEIAGAWGLAGFSQIAPRQLQRLHGRVEGLVGETRKAARHVAEELLLHAQNVESLRGLDDLTDRVKMAERVKPRATVAMATEVGDLHGAAVEVRITYPGALGGIVAAEQLTAIGDAFAYRIKPYAAGPESSIALADWRILADTAGAGGFQTFSQWGREEAEGGLTVHGAKRMQQGAPKALWLVVRENPGVIYAGIETE